jgi:hypothetical protein
MSAPSLQTIQSGHRTESTVDVWETPYMAIPLSVFVCRLTVEDEDGLVVCANPSAEAAGCTRAGL